MTQLTQANTAERLKQLIRSVSDFPKEGIVFRDITTLLADAAGLALAVKAMADPFGDQNVEIVTGAESRGFIFGAAMAITILISAIGTHSRIPHLPSPPAKQHGFRASKLLREVREAGANRSSASR